MWPISQLFESFIKRRDSEILAKADVAGEEYTMREIVDFAIESSLVSGEEFEIGTVIISQLTIKMRLKGNVPINARVIPYVAFDSTAMTWEQAQFPWQEADVPWAGGPSEWMPLGEFYIDSRTRDNDIWRFVCLDKLLWSTQSYESSLAYPATMQAVWDEICAQLGYVDDDTVQINPAYTIAAKPVGYTYREVMGWIAGANSASVRAGKDGRIQFKRYAATNTPDMELTAADYIHAKQTNPLKTYTRFVCQYDDEQDLSYEAGAGGEGETLYMVNPFMTQAMLNGLAATLGGFSYQPMEIDARGFPHIDVGDEIGYEVYEGSTWDATVTPWQDTELPWDGMVRYRSVILLLKMRFAGGFGMALDAPSKSDTQSEYVVEGPLTQAVKKLNQTAAKLGRNYYGVEISREEGLVVEIEGGGGKAVLNADELTFYKGSQKALFFDIPNDRYTFSGHLEAASIAAAIISGSTITGGTINGTTISGTNIYGSNIATGLGTYPMAEMSSSTRSFRASASATRYIDMESVDSSLGTGSPIMTFRDDMTRTWLYQFADKFRMRSDVGDGAEINFAGGLDLVSGSAIRFNYGLNLGTSFSISSASDVSGLRSDFNALILTLRSMRMLS
ncbi:hypothetical protein B1748_29155 [Paenibacillus sp. MY03]|uniref:hypothetical protein n=1 Tax=Paenibacillus sp. MY03 TaxID=302980 RepID=UPI000B3C1BFD|nr:hypothetical protein [Paenibacillus sp. MY03]OUS70305.1 hypothetical protein B1748_29155 [Paenibacillus sp. MY03]